MEHLGQRLGDLRLAHILQCWHKPGSIHKVIAISGRAVVTPLPSEGHLNRRGACSVLAAAT